ncbi:PQQ-dependent sugar dehydrogenase [Dickeya dianthicola]|uniref:PQQ-dependent sugar dehydrogenase n=1 Tax=Dickeya dianthicola TaxID=204039 RepID=UPI00136ACE51|nr:PQQ-dependent sugar dehydrogenase [Dickeya dianthicola]MCI4235700.1 PQQ-dependent sugar dehydrogenase [Dickeya dianthicola]MCI4255549.1 PQQ-dependent sugar dehydrogenase [Dickeya dianthicola]MZG22673.1 PQQ-dependent sugar dehydrogenase [Dickeya dianthicola]MZI87777.1 PQQ-dependent sugar dehydrogenase [Dickeya dianthicola]
MFFPRVHVLTLPLLAAGWLFSMSLFAAPTVAVLQDNLDHPWSLAFLPDDQGLLLTERSGQLRHWQAEKGLSAPIDGVPAVFARSQGGLLDVVLSPNFRQDRRVYLSYAESGPEGLAGTTAGFGVLSDDMRRLSNFTVIFRQLPKRSTGAHFGGRMAFDPQGHLFIALGENQQRMLAQDLGSLQGKLVRLTPEGEVPADNPFVNHSGARPEIWSYGLRNPQGLALNPWSGDIWESEHGPRGGDEVNIPQPGENYGWPLATYGIDYSGQKIPEFQGTKVDGTANPVYYWKVSPAISGMAFYNSGRFSAWRHSLFIGALAGTSLIRLSLEGDRVVSEERLLTDRGERIRDVRVGPDGYLYVLTDQDNGKLLKIGLAE